MLEIKDSFTLKQGRMKSPIRTTFMFYIYISIYPLISNFLDTELLLEHNGHARRTTS